MWPTRPHPQRESPSLGPAPSRAGTPRPDRHPSPPRADQHAGSPAPRVGWCCTCPTDRSWQAGVDELFARRFTRPTPDAARPQRPPRPTGRPRVDRAGQAGGPAHTRSPTTHKQINRTGRLPRDGSRLSWSVSRTRPPEFPARPGVPSHPPTEKSGLAPCQNKGWHGLHEARRSLDSCVTNQETKWRTDRNLIRLPRRNERRRGIRVSTRGRVR
jgi:hypothetical protein